MKAALALLIVVQLGILITAINILLFPITNIIITLSLPRDMLQSSSQIFVKA